MQSTLQSCRKSHRTLLRRWHSVAVTPKTAHRNVLTLPVTFEMQFSNVAILCSKFFLSKSLANSSCSNSSIFSIDFEYSSSETLALKSAFLCCFACSNNTPSALEAAFSALRRFVCSVFFSRTRSLKTVLNYLIWCSIAYRMALFTLFSVGSSSEFRSTVSVSRRLFRSVSADFRSMMLFLLDVDISCE